MTYNTDFEKTLKKIGDWIKAPIECKSVIYAGALENRVGDIKLLNYSHFNELLDFVSES